MVIKGMNAGSCRHISINYRTIEELRTSVQELEEAVVGGSFGYNLIVNKSNIKHKDQLAVIV
jgi:nitronate monooxygenase